VGRILDERLGKLAGDYGIVVGLVDAGGRRVIGRGHLTRGDTRTPDGNTLFELGSITKVFTSLLLAIAVERGEVSLDDPLVHHMPPGTRAPSVDGRQITLRDLATHTSGLPPGPTIPTLKDPNDPYAGYTVEMLDAYLAGAKLRHKPGTEFSYSNLGAALLARALVVRTNKPFAELVRERITVPLQMSNTWIDVPADRQKNLAPGHTETLGPPPYRTHLPTIGNGGVTSCANDMLIFLSASMGLVGTPLASAFRTIEMEHFQLREPGTAMGLGWRLAKLGDRTLVWHSGGTGGFRTIAVYEQPARRGAVVLSNVFTEGGVDDIAYYLLDGGELEEPGATLVTPIRYEASVAIDPSVLDRYVGDYQLTSHVTLSVSRMGDELLVQLTGQPKYRVFPESDHVFFLAHGAAATLTFEADGQGKTVAVVWYENGRHERAPKLDTRP
jgi:CubicO group peptidase (beta-lactamase class C family)